MSCFFSTFFATSHTEISDTHRSCSAPLEAIRDFARADSRRSSVTHQSQAWVSRSVGIGIPSFARAERISDLFQHAAGETVLLRGRDVGHQLRDRTPAFRDHDGRFRGGDLVQSFQRSLNLPAAMDFMVHGGHGRMAMSILQSRLPGSSAALSADFASRSPPGSAAVSAASAAARRSTIRVPPSGANWLLLRNCSAAATLQG